MTTQPEAQSQSDDAKGPTRTTNGETVVGFAVLGCLAAGTVGICKAILMDGIGAAFCLFASVAAFGAVCYIYYRER